MRTDDEIIRRYRNDEYSVLTPSERIRLIELLDTFYKDIDL